MSHSSSFAASRRGKNHHIHVFDNALARPSCPPVHKVGAERGYYNVPASFAPDVWDRAKLTRVPGVTGDAPQVSLEPALGNVESRAAGILQRLTRDGGGDHASQCYRNVRGHPLVVARRGKMADKTEDDVATRRALSAGYMVEQYTARPGGWPSVNDRLKLRTRDLLKFPTAGACSVLLSV